MEYESRERTIRREAFLEIPMVEAMLRCFAALVHGENFPFDGGDIALMFLHDLRSNEAWRSRGTCMGCSPREVLSAFSE